LKKSLFELSAKFNTQRHQPFPIDQYLEIPTDIPSSPDGHDRTTQDSTHFQLKADFKVCHSFLMVRVILELYIVVDSRQQANLWPLGHLINPLEYGIF
jgi:hypothetical protein